MKSILGETFMEMILFKTLSGQNYIRNNGVFDNECQAIRHKINMQVRAKEDIQEMSFGSLRAYRRRIKVVADYVHKNGTPEAIEAIDCLIHTTDQVWLSNEFDTYDFNTKAKNV
jgi:hypothetical protein